MECLGHGTGETRSRHEADEPQDKNAGCVNFVTDVLAGVTLGTLRRHINHSRGLFVAQISPGPCQLGTSRCEKAVELPSEQVVCRVGVVHEEVGGETSGTFGGVPGAAGERRATP